LAALADTLNGGAGNDILQGDDNFNTDSHYMVFGGCGDDAITSYSSIETIDAGSGDDDVEVWTAGRDQTLEGGLDTDWLNLAAFQITSGVRFALADEAIAVVKGVDLATYRGFERLNFIGGEYIAPSAAVKWMISSF